MRGSELSQLATESFSCMVDSSFYAVLRTNNVRIESTVEPTRPYMTLRKRLF